MYGQKTNTFIGASKSYFSSLPVLDFVFPFVPVFLAPRGPASLSVSLSDPVPALAEGEIMTLRDFPAIMRGKQLPQVIESSRPMSVPSPRSYVLSSLLCRPPDWFRLRPLKCVLKTLSFSIVCCRLVAYCTIIVVFRNKRVCLIPKIFLFKLYQTHISWNLFEVLFSDLVTSYFTQPSNALQNEHSQTKVY